MAEEIALSHPPKKVFPTPAGIPVIAHSIVPPTLSPSLFAARISFCIGNKDIVNGLRIIRSQYDFGMFMPIQKAAITALKTPREEVLKQCAEYQKRRDTLCGGLRKIGWNVPDSKGTMFVWASIPQNFSSSMEFWNELVDKTGVICTPGTAFGPMGEGYVRFALVLPPEQLKEVVDIIDKSGILK